MRALLLLVLAVVVVGGGLKMAGVRLPLIDYSIGPVGGEDGPALPDIRVEPPGFDDFGP